MQGLVKTVKESQQVRGTYQLSSAEGGKNQDRERKQARREAVLTICRIQRDGLIRTAKEGQLARSHSRAVECRGRDSVVKNVKNAKRARGTHRLSSAVEGTHQDTECEGGGRYEYRIRSQDVGNM
jgi:hypothetical protein